MSLEKAVYFLFLIGLTYKNLIGCDPIDDYINKFVKF